MDHYATSPDMWDSIEQAIERGKRNMESTAIKQVQAPELALSAEIEPFAKGGWKTTIRASVRTFDGKHEDLYDQLSMMLANGLAIAKQAIEDHEKKEGTNE